MHNAKESFEKLNLMEETELKVSEPIKSEILKEGEFIFFKPFLDFKNKQFREKDDLKEKHFEPHHQFEDFKNRRDFQTKKNRHKDLEIILYKEELYILNENSKELFKSEIAFSRDFSATYGGLLFLFLMSFSYILVIKSIKPLKNLEIAIRRFGDGNFDKTFEDINSNDEVGRIWREFKGAVLKIEALERSRELFLRNILHELKTPITKGKLVVAILGERRETTILNSVFNRLDSLINEMANIEKLISKSGEHSLFSKKSVRAVLEDALKIGFIERDRVDIVGDKNIICDPTLLSIAFKNLLDNGIKYSFDQKVHVKVIGKKVVFISNGERLPKDFQEYLKPFSHSQISSKRGFGLGLYIVSEVSIRHNIGFNYRYLFGKNIFSVDF